MAAPRKMSTFQKLKEAISQQLIPSTSEELHVRFRSISRYDKVMELQRKLLDLISKLEEQQVTGEFVLLLKIELMPCHTGCSQEASH